MLDKHTDEEYLKIPKQFKVGYTRSRGCLALRCFSITGWDKDLEIPLNNPMDLILFNPKSVPASKQIDFAFTLENAASDYLYRDDGVMAFVNTSFVNLYTDDDGNAELFTASSFDDLIDKLGRYLPDKSHWNARTRNVLTMRKASFNKYIFNKLTPNFTCEPWTGIYAKMGLSPFGAPPEEGLAAS